MARPDAAPPAVSLAPEARPANGGSFRDAAALEAAAQALNGPSGFFEWPADEPEHLAAFWALFLDGPFHADNWTFVVSREKASVY